MRKLALLCAVVLSVASVFAAAPKCSIEKEFWGHEYLKLVDVNGVEYKLSVPASGTSTRFKTRTGWYKIDSTGKILQYQDKVVLQSTPKKVKVIQ